MSNNKVQDQLILYNINYKYRINLTICQRENNKC